MGSETTLADRVTTLGLDRVLEVAVEWWRENRHHDIPPAVEGRHRPCATFIKQDPPSVPPCPNVNCDIISHAVIFSVINDKFYSVSSRHTCRKGRTH